MKRILLILLFLWSSVGAPLPAFAQSPELMKANRQYKALHAAGKYARAELYARLALMLGQTEFGPNHKNYAILLNNLAALYKDQGRYDEAEPLHKRALTIREKVLGPYHPDVAQSLNNLAALYDSQGRYGKAESLYKRSLLIREKSLGHDHPSVAQSLNNMAALYSSQGRHGEAELLYKRALTIREKAFGPDHPALATTLSNLSALYHKQGRYEEAEPLLKRSLAIKMKALGPDHPTVRTSLNNLAALFQAQGRDDDAEPLYKRSLAIAEKSLGPNHPNVAQALNNLARLYHRQGYHDEAEPLFKRALSIDEKTFGPNHPDVAMSLNNLAGVYWARGRHDLALEHFRRASAIHLRRVTRMGGVRSVGGRTEQRQVRYVFLRHLEATVAGFGGDSSKRSALTREGFEVAQLANATGAGTAVSRMAARFAAGDDMLAASVRERQDAVERWRKLDGSLVKAASRGPGKRDKAGEATMRRELSALDAKIKEIDDRLATTFPQFAELSAPKPLPLVEAQALLAEDEALLTYLVWDKVSFVFAVRRNRVLVKQIELGAGELSDAVTALRRALAPDFVQSLADIPSFNTTRAFALYRKLFAPVENILKGARHVFVVPDGALQSLPLGVLVTEKPVGSFTDYSGYRHTKWLAKKYAMTTLPSVSSLRALRTFARRSKATRPFLGIGDPKLLGETGSGRGVKLASLFTPRGVADVNAVRQLPSLPDTAGELRAMAQTLGAGEDALLLGTEASETRLKQTSLKDYKVLAFATHGLLAGDLAGLAEPALVLTPPAKGSEQDDGLLTASEVAQLKLDADWVILSACNTAAADGTPGAEGLSGLAKAFFYAGSRTLLVSHWPVASDAAVKITTRMLAEAAKPGVGRAEAHRRAMMAMIDDEDNPHYAHPLFWAPFVVVGEGGSPGRSSK